jgi:hypothetical protein
MVCGRPCNAMALAISWPYVVRAAAASGYRALSIGDAPHRCTVGVFGAQGPAVDEAREVAEARVELEAQAPLGAPARPSEERLGGNWGEYTTWQCLACLF